MKLTIKTTRIEITNAISEYIEKRIRPLEKFIESFRGDVFIEGSQKIKKEAEIIIDVGKELGEGKGLFFAKAQILFPGKELIVKTTSYDLRKAIDNLKAAMQRKLTEEKKKPMAVHKRGARSSKKDFKLDAAARSYRKGRIREEGM